MKIILLLSVFLLSCANYSNKKHVITTTKTPEGVVIVVEETCETALSSMREFGAGDLNIQAGCTVSSSAVGMKGNDKAYDALNALIGKIP